MSCLTSATHPLASGLVPEAFAYDPVGNRTSSHLSASYAHSSANRLLEDDAFTYGYDANGNRASKTEKTTGLTTTYTYDGEDQLVHVDLPGGGSASYRYDGLGRRIEKTVNGQRQGFLYEGEDLWLLYEPVSRCARTAFFHGPGVDAPFGFFTDDSGIPVTGYRNEPRWCASHQMSPDGPPRPYRRA